MTHYDTAADLLFNCTILYLTPSGQRRYFRTKTIAPAADLAVELAERQARCDRRRQIATIVYTQAVQA